MDIKRLQELSGVTSRNVEADVLTEASANTNHLRKMAGLEPLVEKKDDCCECTTEGCKCGGKKCECGGKCDCKNCCAPKAVNESAEKVAAHLFGEMDGHDIEALADEHGEDASDMDGSDKEALVLKHVKKMSPEEFAKAKKNAGIAPKAVNEGIEDRHSEVMGEFNQKKQFMRPGAITHFKQIAAEFDHAHDEDDEDLMDEILDDMQQTVRETSI